MLICADFTTPTPAVSIPTWGYIQIILPCYTMTMKQLRKIHDEINSDIFGGCLDMPQFLCSHDGKHYGWWLGNDNHSHYGIININPVYCADWLLIFGTMAHEMIHQYQEYENKRLTHGKFFYKMASEIETFYQLPKGSI